MFVQKPWKILSKCFTKLSKTTQTCLNIAQKCILNKNFPSNKVLFLLKVCLIYTKLEAGNCKYHLETLCDFQKTTQRWSASNSEVNNKIIVCQCTKFITSLIHCTPYRYGLSNNVQRRHVLKVSLSISHLKEPPFSLSTAKQWNVHQLQNNYFALHCQSLL